MVKKISYHSTFTQGELLCSCLFALSRRHGDNEHISLELQSSCWMQFALPHPLFSVRVSVKFRASPDLCNTGQLWPVCQYLPSAVYIQNTVLQKSTNYCRNSSLSGKLGSFKGGSSHPLVTDPLTVKWNCEDVYRNQTSAKGTIQNEESQQEPQ